MKHTTLSLLLSQRVTIDLVGVGGNGSQLLTGLARLDRAMRALGHPGGLRVTAWDPDLVSEANVGRQLFAPSDVGLAKASVLIHRVNCYYGLQWQAEARRYSLRMGARPADILVTCVDSAAARREIHGQIWRKDIVTPLYWLDLGNRQQDGQAILGQPAKGYQTGEVSSTEWAAGKPYKKVQPAPARLPCVTELYPELLDETLPEDDRPSCSLAEALESQDLMINQAVATWGLELLWRLFRDGGLDHHGFYINLADGRVNPIPVPSKGGERENEVAVSGNRRAGRRRPARHPVQPAAA